MRAKRGEGPGGGDKCTQGGDGCLVPPTLGPSSGRGFSGSSAVGLEGAATSMTHPSVDRGGEW